MRWGLIPSWAKDPSVGAQLINARSETMTQKPSFRDAVRKRRCLVPVSGFYEWKRSGKTKVPYYIRLDQDPDEPLAFAGIWEIWKPRGPDARPIETFAILTTEANEAVKGLHDRMPWILQGPSEQLAWLQGRLATPGPAPQLRLQAVSTRVNSPQNDDPSLIDPVPEPLPPQQGEFGF